MTGFASAGTGTAKRHRLRPVAKSYAQISRCFSSAPERKTFPPEMIGEFQPGSVRSAFQSKPLPLGTSQSAGRFIAFGTDDPPRKDGHPVVLSGAILLATLGAVAGLVRGGVGAELVRGSGASAVPPNAVGTLATGLGAAAPTTADPTGGAVTAREVPAGGSPAGAPGAVGVT